MRMYEVKPDVEVSTSDFWYDLFDGGYLKPEDILVNAEDITEVQEAIDVIAKFQLSCEIQIPDFLR